MLLPRTAQQGPSRSNLAPNSAVTDRGPSSRTATLSVAHGPVVNIVSDSDLRQTPESFHQEASQSICREQGQPVIRHPDNTRAETQTSPVANPAPVAQGPHNNNYGTLNLPSVSESFGVGALASTVDCQSNCIQVNQSPNPMPSVFDPISSHIPVKNKRAFLIWRVHRFEFTFKICS